jgi:radical SAM protein with 4Fe4S-binding SPASM domain
MKGENRCQYLMQSPKILWDLFVLAKYDFIYDQMPVCLRHMSLKKRINLLKAGLNVLWRKLTPWNWPLHMQFELTNYCNLKCPVCPIGIGVLDRRPIAMDLNFFERLMNEVGPYLLTASLWAWGESLLHPNLGEILRIAKKYSVATLVSTNGQKLSDEKVLDALIGHPPTYLIVCIDGLTDETNAVFRVGSRLDRTLRGVKSLAEMKRKAHSELPILHMRYIVMKHNQHELPHLQTFAEKNMFDFLSIRTLSIIDSDEKAHREFVPDLEEFRAYEYEGGRRIRRQDYLCQHAFSFPSVFADGTIVACDQDYNAQNPYGAVADKVSFRDIWFGKSAAGVRRIIRNNRQSLSFCKECPYADRPVSINMCSVKSFDLRQPEDRFGPTLTG